MPLGIVGWGAATMNWFAIACLAGFFLYLYRTNVKSTLKVVWKAKGLFWGVVILAVVFALVVLHATSSYSFYLWMSARDNASEQWKWLAATGAAFERFFHFFDGDETARIVIGGTLGAVVGYAYEHDFFKPKGSGVEHHKPIYILGASLLVLGVFLPHLDRFLNQMTSLKTQFIEIHLADISTKEAQVKPDTRHAAFTDGMLDIVGGYGRKIIQDFEFLRDIELGGLMAKQEMIQAERDWQAAQFDLAGASPARKRELTERANAAAKKLAGLDKKLKEIEGNDELKKLKDASEAFVTAISPYAACISMAVEKGASVQNARAAVRDFAVRLQQLRENSDGTHVTTDLMNRLGGSSEAVFEHLKLRRGQLTQAVNPLTTKEKEELESINTCLDSVLSAARGKNFMVDRDLPQFDATLAAFALYADNDTDSALSLLDRAWKKMEDRRKAGSRIYDYRLPSMIATVNYYLTQRVSYYRPHLASLEAVTNERIGVVEDARQEFCRRFPGSPCDATFNFFDSHWGRAKLNEAIAMNFTAYGIAQDMASGEDVAASMAPIALDVANKLQGLIDESDNCEKGALSANRNCLSFMPTLNKDEFTDTIAYVMLVTEASKPRPDKAKIRTAVEIFQRQSSYTEYSIDPAEENDYAYARARQQRLAIIKRSTARSHLLSALRMLGNDD